MEFSSAIVGRIPLALRALYNVLIKHFDHSRIFMDVATIAPGVDFVRAIEEAIASSGIFVALIGRGWLQPHLDERNDYVRFEIATALRLGVRVVPVLVNGAEIPKAEDLPMDLSPIAHRHGLRLRHAEFEWDVQKILNAINIKEGSAHVVKDTPQLWRWTTTMITFVAFFLSGYFVGSVLEQALKLPDNPIPAISCTAIWIAGVVAAIRVWRYGAAATRRSVPRRTGTDN